MLASQAARVRSQTFGQTSAIDAVKEQLLRFVEPERRGEFLAAFSRFVTRRDVDVAALRSLVVPFLRCGMAGEFETFLKRTRK